MKKQIVLLGEQCDFAQMLRCINRSVLCRLRNGDHTWLRKVYVAFSDNSFFDGSDIKLSVLVGLQRKKSAPRNCFWRGRTKEATEVLDLVMKNITPQSYAYDVPMYYMAISYYRAGAKDKGSKLAFALSKNMEDDVKYILSFDDEDRRASMARDIQNDLTIINILSNIATQAGDTTTGNQLSQKFQALAQTVSGKMDMRSFQQ